MTDTAYSHLLPAAQTLADAPDEVRIRRIRTDRWIGYTRAELALAQMPSMKCTTYCPAHTSSNGAF